MEMYNVPFKARNQTKLPDRMIKQFRIAVKPTNLFFCDILLMKKGKFDRQESFKIKCQRYYNWRTLRKENDNNGDDDFNVIFM